MVKLSNHFRRATASNYACWDVSRDKGAIGNDRAVADRDALEYLYVRSDENAVANADWLCPLELGYLPLAYLQSMKVAVKNLDSSTNEAILAYDNA